eukprot:421459-Pyramimonas_sp.AAC.1
MSRTQIRPEPSGWTCQEQQFLQPRPRIARPGKVAKQDALRSSLADLSPHLQLVTRAFKFPLLKTECAQEPLPG